MKKDLPNNKDNIFFRKIHKLINLIDQLIECGVKEYIKLPSICVLGTQSSGKTSVLESILGLDFLPRGEDIITRRPLELHLCHINSGQPWAIFEEKKGTKFTDFTKVRETIEALIGEVCQKGKNIIDKPIVLNIYSQTFPDITLVDLPGIISVPIDDQPKNIEEITNNMARRYVEDPLTLILCVVSANSDIDTNDGLMLAKEIDTSGSRTLGVITKLDIMDEGSDVRNLLLNEEIPLKFGYVGVKNHSKKDLVGGLSVEASSEIEREFFKYHQLFKKSPSDLLGTEILINKLSKLYFRLIKENFPRITNSIINRIKSAEEELRSLGQPIPTGKAEKMSFLLNMINEYCDTFIKVLQEKCYDKNYKFLEGEGIFKINILYKTLLENFTGEYKATAEYTDDNIKNALTIYEGDTFPGFISTDVFICLLRPQLEKLKNPIEECFKNVFQYLEILSEKILLKIFSRFPQAIDYIIIFITNYLIEERDKTK